MKKFALILTAVILCCAIFAGCDINIDELTPSATAQTSSEPTENTNTYSKYSSVDMGELALKESDICLKIGGKSFSVLTDSEKLKSAIDAKQSASGEETMDNATDGGSIAYDNGFSFNQTSVGDGSVWYFADITGQCDYSTSRGISIGASYADVTKAFGEPYWKDTNSDGYSVTYCISSTKDDYSSPCIIFFFIKDVVSEIQLCYPIS